MIYPQKMSSKKSNQLINALVIGSIMIALILVLINKTTTPNIPWAAISNAGIMYIWIIVIYSIKRNTNIAAHVLLQIITISLVILYIDNKLGGYGWSIYIGIPIILIVANITMLVLAIISYRNYAKYTIYQLIIVVISIIQIWLVLDGIISFGILNKISIGISLLNFFISLILRYKAFWKMLVCKFHM